MDYNSMFSIFIKWSKSKSVLIERLETTLSITVANNLSTDKTVILSQGRFCGIVSVVITSSKQEASIFSYACPEKTECTHIALTDFAPNSLIVSAALQIVPAVSIISSTKTTSLSLVILIRMSLETTQAQRI